MMILLGAALTAPAQAQFVGGPGPDQIIGSIANETFRGLGGGDRLVGDFSGTGPGFPDYEIPCRAGAGVEHAPVNGASSITAALGNDVFDDGTGDDVIIGDATAVEFGEFQVYALAGTGAIMGGGGGGSNVARCFSDTNAVRFGEDSFIGGPGADTFVGDAFYTNTHPEDLNMDAGAGSAGMGRYSFYPYGPGGGGGSNNTLEAFNDVIDFSPSFSGAKLLVGDAYGQNASGSENHLNASAGSGGKSNFANDPGGAGGHFNTLSAYNDRIIGAGEDDRIIGDDLRAGGAGGESRLVASAGAGGEDAGGTGGAGGSGNTLQAFSDTIEGGLGSDLLIGDAFHDQGPTNDMRFVVHSGFAGGGAGGVNNAVSAFNDRIEGGPGVDAIAGEGWNRGANDAVRFIVGIGGGNNARAFSDRINAGAGGDLISGDLRYDTPVCDIDEVSLSIAGQASLFGDTIVGGPGNDRIHGGFGADQMTGDLGRDAYPYYGPDLFDVIPGPGQPIDTITDFQVFGPLANRDVIDLRPLLVSCEGVAIAPGPAGAAVANEHMQIIGATLFVDLDGAGGQAAIPILTAASLASVPVFGSPATKVNFLRANGNLLP